MKNTMPFSEIGTSAKILRWLTPSEGELLDSLALAWNLWGTWIPVCCFLSSRYGISSYCGFPLLQPVIALEFFQHRILRSKYLNFLEEFFIVFISDIFGKFRKSHDHSKLPRISMNHGTRKATHVIRIGRRWDHRCNFCTFQVHFV